MVTVAALRRPGSNRRAVLAFLLVALAMGAPAAVAAEPTQWQADWPKTDFARHTVPLGEIVSGGVPRDGIPPIDHPKFASAEKVAHLYKGTEPVITVVVGDRARAYPLGILMSHEIVNDTLGGQHFAVTYCPLCNSAIVFDRVVGGRELTFGVTGKLRNSDLVMWDRQTESWWQQFSGVGIVGAMAGTELTMLPVRIESFGRFRERFPDGGVLLDPQGGTGFNPYAGYDSAAKPKFYKGSFPPGIRPLDYVVAVGNEAWALPLLRQKKRIEAGDLVLHWSPGQNAALDRRDIAQGHDIGNVTVERRVNDLIEDTVYTVTFAFAFHAFHPDGTIHK